MPYCPRCGVEVDYEIKKCPLCEFDIPPIPRNDPLARMEVSQFRNYYVELREEKKRRVRKVKLVVFLILTGLSLYSVLQVGFLDWIADRSMSFSPYVMSSLILFIVILYILFGYARKGKHVFSILFLFVSAFLLSLDLYDSSQRWFWDMGFPLTIASLGIAFAVSQIIKRVKKIWQYGLAAILAGGGLLCFFVEMIIDLKINGEFTMNWSGQVLFFTLPLALIFIVLKLILPTRIADSFRRYFHL
jgi:hypothetical protein